MRQPFAGVAFLTGVLVMAAPDASVHAADHQYFVTSTTNDSAALADLGGRSRVGDMVSFDLILLRRTPVKVGAVDAYWADGIEEVDCANHRRRVMLISGLSLDRSGKANQPGANFREWEVNQPGTAGRDVEDLVCRNVRSGGVRPVADLAGFQREFFRSGAQVAAAPPAAAPKVAPAPPPAPTRPAATTAAAQPRYLVTSYSKDSVFMVDRTQVRRTGNIVNSVNYELTAKPHRYGGLDSYWSEVVKEHDCVQHRVRLNLIAVMSLDRRQRVESGPGSSFFPWEPITPKSIEAEEEALACNGQLGRFMTASANDLDQIQRAFFAFAANQEPKFVLGPNAAPPVTTAAAQPPLVIASYDKKSAEIIDRRTIKRTGPIASATTWLFWVDPSKLGGVAYNWTERTMEVDCVKHQYRRMIVSAHTTDFSKSADLPKLDFSAWEANDGTMDSDNEAVLCNERAAPRMIALNALSDLPARFLAYARSSETEFRGLSTAAAPARPAAPPRPPPAQDDDKPLELVLMTVNPGGATIANRASLKRSGDVVTIAVITLSRQPVKKGGFDLYWTETDHQVDCAGHRRRTKTTYMHTLEMDHQEPITGPYTEWTPIAADSQPFEAFTCRAVMPTTFQEIAGLQIFQRTFFQRGPAAFGPPPSPPSRATAAPAPPSAARPAASKADYVLSNVGPEGGTLIDRASIKRQGDVTTYNDLTLLPKAERVEGADYQWSTFTNQIDCKGHRTRVRMDSFLSLDRRQRFDNPQPSYEAWEANKPGSFAAQLEDFICRGKGAAEFEPTPDLAAFQENFLLAIKAGAFK